MCVCARVRVRVYMRVCVRPYARVYMCTRVCMRVCKLDIYELIQIYIGEKKKGAVAPFIQLFLLLAAKCRPDLKVEMKAGKQCCAGPGSS